eukprot:1156458-Pelagomonas_calceolata.AAC.3
MDFKEKKGQTKIVGEPSLAFTGDLARPPLACRRPVRIIRCGGRGWRCDCRSPFRPQRGKRHRQHELHHALHPCAVDVQELWTHQLDMSQFRMSAAQMIATFDEVLAALFQCTAANCTAADVSRFKMRAAKMVAAFGEVLAALYKCTAADVFQFKMRAAQMMAALDEVLVLLHQREPHDAGRLLCERAICLDYHGCERRPRDA